VAKDAQAQNAIQQKLIDELRTDLRTAEQKLKQLNIQLEEARKGGGINAAALQEEVDALERAPEEKKQLIAAMRKQLMGDPMLPPELNDMLEQFANSQDMVTYDASRGLVKFKSDLLFDKGSAVVAADSAEAVKSLCGIMNSSDGSQFDIIVAGHTDDIRISRPATREKHPDNWHLSAHRALGVLSIMTANNIDPGRLSGRAFGEFRPIAENAPNKKGNPQNRRVEIYIVAKGS
jgi:chemotaxis protein MotB